MGLFFSVHGQLILQRLRDTKNLTWSMMLTAPFSVQTDAWVKVFLNMPIKYLVCSIAEISVKKT